MNTAEVYALLEKFYEGKLSDEQENELRDFFRKGNIPPELEDEREMFSYYDTTAQAPMPDAGFEARIINATATGGQSLSIFRNRKYVLAFMSSAAAFLLLFGTWFFFVRRSEPADTFTDPKLAYNETMKVLYSVSAKMNTGFDALESARKASSVAKRNISRVGRSTDMINQNLKPLNYFKKAMVIVSSPLETGALHK
jgi:hypothetical protein